MRIEFTVKGTRVNGHYMEVTKEAVGDQLKYMLFGMVPPTK